VTELSVFVYAFDDSSIGTGADIAFDAGDGTPGERIANIDAEEMWYGGTMPVDDHLSCDFHTCILWVVIDADMLDYTHVRDAEAAVYLDLPEPRASARGIRPPRTPPTASPGSADPSPGVERHISRAQKAFLSRIGQ